MIKTILLQAFVLCVIVFANSPTNDLGLQKEPQATEERTLKTKKDLLEFIATLEGAYRLGDKAKGYLLGGVYSQRHVLADGVVEADTETALKYFKEALIAGYGLSAWHIVLLEDVPKKDYFHALDVLEEGIVAKYTDQNSKTTLALTHGTIVLENLNENIKMVRKARDLLYPFAIKANLASVDYVLANLLNLNNEFDDANKFLNSACNNPEAPKEIINACMGGSEIETTDAKTGTIMKKETSACK